MGFDNEHEPDDLLRRLLGETGFDFLMRDLGTGQDEVLGEDAGDGDFAHVGDDAPAAEPFEISPDDETQVPETLADAQSDDTTPDHAFDETHLPAPYPAGDSPGVASAAAGVPAAGGLGPQPQADQQPDVGRSPAARRTAEHDQLTALLWRLHQKALPRKARAGTRELDQLIASGVLDYIEWWLISVCRESVPAGSGPWDCARRQEEIERRQKRLDYVESRRLHKYTKWWGLFHLLLTKRPLPQAQFYLEQLRKVAREPDFLDPFE